MLVATQVYCVRCLRGSTCALALFLIYRHPTIESVFYEGVGIGLIPTHR